MKKSLSMMIVMALLFVCFSACSNEGNNTAYNPAYSSITMFKCTYVFDGDIKSEDGGNYKYTTTKEYDEKNGDYDNIEASTTGTYKWTSENKTLSLKSNDGKIVETYFVIGDYLISDALINSAREIKMKGNFLDCTVNSLTSVTEYKPNGTYTYYETDFYGEVDYSSFGSGVYYIKDEILYKKAADATEYEMSCLILENKLFDILLLPAYKLEKE